MLDHFRAMAVFARTVEEGSFRGAGKKLGLSPSVVSHHVAQLEEALGTTLLFRTTRRIALTADGEKLFEAARSMVTAAEAGFFSIAQRSKAQTGSLCVTAPAALIHGQLADDLAEFALALPEVELTFLLSDTPLDLLGERVDLAIRAGSLEDSPLKSKAIGVIERVLVAAPRYAAARPAPRAPKDLERWQWIRLKSRPPLASFTGPVGQRAAVTMASRLVVDNAAAMLEFAERGLGLATAPAGLARAALSQGKVVEVLPDWRLESPRIFAVWHPQAPRTSLAIRLVDFLSKRAEKATPRGG